MSRSLILRGNQQPSACVRGTYGSTKKIKTPNSLRHLCSARCRGCAKHTIQHPDRCATAPSQRLPKYNDRTTPARANESSEQNNNARHRNRQRSKHTPRKPIETSARTNRKSQRKSRSRISASSSTGATRCAPTRSMRRFRTLIFAKLIFLKTKTHRMFLEYLQNIVESA